jgi:predicted MFS family arabinose efflux permease
VEATRFPPAERRLVGAAAAVVGTRVLAFSLTLLGFTEFARALPGAPAGWEDLLAGIALGGYGATMALAQLASGVLSDRLGRRPVLAGGTALFVAGAVLCAVATDAWGLLAGRLLAGLGGISSVAMAAVGERVPEQRRTTAMALVGIPAGLAVFLGFAAGPPLAAWLGFRSLFWLTAVLGGLAVLPLLREAMPAPASRPSRWSLGLPVAALAACGFAGNFAMTAVMFDFASTVLDRIGQGALALLLLGALLVMGVASRLADRRGTATAALVACVLLLAASAPLFRLAPTPWAVAGGLLFLAAHATLSALVPSQVSRLAGRHGGTGHGFQLVVAYLGSAAGGAAAGLAHPALERVFVALAAIGAFAAGLCAFGLRPRAASVGVAA